MSILSRFARRIVPQHQPIPGSTQVPNSAGGFTWRIDPFAQLTRFLVLGCEGGTFYAGEWDLTRQNAAAVETAIGLDGPRAVRTIVAISAAGRAPRNDAAIFSLAMAAGLGDEPTRCAALDALPQVCRTATHLMQFVDFVGGFRGWGRSLRRAVGAWYADRPIDDLAYQVVKYRNRAGFTHRDVLRLAHPGRSVSAANPTLTVTDAHERLFEWIVRGGDTDGLPAIVGAFARAQDAATPGASARLVREHRLPREAVRTDHLTSPEVWEALSEDMPMTAMVRNLATMTRVGVIAPGSEVTHRVVARLTDRDAIRRARIHPIAVLAALSTYGAGRGARGRHTWTPVQAVVNALDAAFTMAFDNVEPTGVRTTLALDVSGSMDWGQVAGVPGLTPRVASAALALVTAATEPDCEIVGFHSGHGSWSCGGRRRDGLMGQGIAPVPISPRQRLDDALRIVHGLPFGATDCALPMRFAQATGRKVDCFVVYTDNETWSGDVHPARALVDYRAATGIDARLVVVGMTATGFSIADPDDPGMLDVVGFDTATPALIADFARGLV